MKRILLSIVLAGLPFASVAQGPEPPQVAPPVPQAPTLRASVDQVVVDVVVTDADGKVVGGLTAADFELRDRGTPQAVATFSEVSLPLTIRGAGAPLAAPGDIRSNTQGAGRLYVLVLDDFHIGVDLTTLVRDTVDPYRQPAPSTSNHDMSAFCHPETRTVVSTTLVPSYA